MFLRDVNLRVCFNATQRKATHKTAPISSIVKSVVSS